MSTAEAALLPRARSPACRNMNRIIVIAASATCAALVSSSARAQSNVGAEFLDPPEDKSAKPAEPPSEDEKKDAGYIPGYRRIPSVGLSPHAPQNVPGLPGLVTPAFGAPVVGSDWRFEFHGYLATAFRMGIGHRDTALEGQKITTLHGDPIVPGGAYGWLEHTNIVPGPWSQLTFQYGNDTVRATAIIGSWSLGRAQDATGYAQTEAQIWLNDAFVVYTPKVAPFGLAVTAGVFTDQYGQMAQYSNGSYGVPLMGGIRGIGIKSALQIPLESSVDVTVEGGFKGGFNRVPVGIAIDASTNFPRPEEGSTYAAHGHISATWNNVTPALHYIRSWSQDDVFAPDDDPLTVVDESISRPDGSLDIMGADIRANMARFGYVYAGVSHMVGKDTISINNLVSVLNSGGGRDYMERFWGFSSGGNGKLTLVGAEYTLSLGTLLRYPDEFWGVGPDLSFTVFGMYAHADGGCDQFSLRTDGTSCVPGGVDGEYDTQALKYGIEGVYSFSEHVIATLRLDQVSPDLDYSGQSFTAITPRLIFRTSWIARETVGIQYSGFLFGDEVPINGDTRLVNTNSQNPDSHMFALFATMYW
jgi:hypothetical protein